MDFILQAQERVKTVENSSRGKTAPDETTGVC